jgi:hypothetical protein
VLNNIDFSNTTNSIPKDTEAFKNIKKYSKLTNSNISNDLLNNNLKYQKINNLYLNNNTTNNNSFNYGLYKEHNFVSLNSTLPSYSTLVDKNSLNKLNRSCSKKFKQGVSAITGGSSRMYDLHSRDTTKGYNCKTDCAKISRDEERRYRHNPKD